MNCSACGHENRSERRFCAVCGGALATPCPRCKFGNLPGERFCGGCGVSLDAPAPAGERRQVAILFADLAGYTKLSTTLDPEEVHRLLTGFFDAVDGVCTRFGGTIDKHIGDNVMAIFGAPVAHGDDPERAVRAGVEIHRAVAEYSGRVGRVLSVHVGIAYGEVMASGLGSAHHVEYTVTGDAVNLAARLQDKAMGGETLMSDAVYRAAARIAIAEPVGEIAVKGLPAPVAVWRLLEVGTGATTAPIRLIGRDKELAQILAAIEQGGWIVVRGEAGIGKSALVAEVARRAPERGLAVHAAQVLDFGQGRGAGAIPTIVASLLGAPILDEDARRRALEAAHEGDRVHLASLLELDVEEPAGDDRERRAQQHAALAALIAAQTRPPLVLVEDVHWADTATRSRLAVVAEAIAKRDGAILMTSRESEGEGETLELGPLTADAAAQLAADQLADPDLIGRCVERAAGNPLFLEHLVQSATRDTALPGTLQGLVLARIDRLPPRDKAALGAASVVGQRAPLALVRHLLRDDAWEPDEVIARRLLARSGGELAFRHALVLDGVYASLTFARRRELHRAAAAWFAGMDSALHAEHLERADDAAAANAFLAAAEEHRALHDVDRALALIERGVACAKASDQRYALHSLAGKIQLDLGETRAAEAAWRAALAEADGEMARCRALIGLAGAHRFASEVEAGTSVLDEAERLAAARGADLELAQIEYLRGSLAFFTSEPARCRTHHQRALELARRVGAPEWEARALSGLGDAHYASGEYAEAADAFGACADVARNLGLIGYSLTNRAMYGDSLSQLMRFEESERVLTEVVDDAIAHRAGRAEALALESLALVRMLAWKSDGLEVLVERAIERCRSLGMAMFEASGLVVAAEVWRAKGDLARARAAAQRAAAMTKSWSFLAGFDIAARFLDAETEAERRELLRPLDGGVTDKALSMVYLRRNVIEHAMLLEDWELVADQAALLAREAAHTPYGTFVAARGMALAAWGRGERGAELVTEIQRLRAQALDAGVQAPFPIT